jgi:hypothetical protein
MRECGNGEMRDLLPDLLGDASGRAELAAARAHVSECESCREELAFLRDARRLVPTPRVDVPRIAAAIPPYRPVSAWGRVSRSPLARIAAVIVLVVGVATVGRQVATAPTHPDTMVAVQQPQPTSELTVGTLNDLSDSDLENFLEDLGDLEAVPSTEEDVVVLPALDRSGV